MPFSKRHLVNRRYWDDQPVDTLALESRESYASVAMQLTRIRKELGDCVRRQLCRFASLRKPLPGENARAELIEHVLDRKPGSGRAFYRAWRSDPDFRHDWLESASIHAAILYYRDQLRVAFPTEPQADAHARTLPWLRIAAALAILTGVTAWAANHFLNRSAVLLASESTVTVVPVHPVAPLPAAAPTTATNLTFVAELVPVTNVVVADSVAETSAADSSTGETNMSIQSTTLTLTSAVAFAATALVTPASVQATDFVWSGAGSNACWATAENWVGHVAPGVGAAVSIPDGISVLATDEDAAILSVVGNFTLGSGATLSISNETLLSVTGKVSGASGTLVKLGAGTLQAFGPSDKYYGKTIVSNGLFQTFKTTTSIWEDPSMGSVYVYAPGIFGTATNTDAITAVSQLWGDGTVTNVAASGGFQLHIIDRAHLSEFSGQISGWSGTNGANQISDGGGKLSLAKAGSNTWALEGSNTFSGTLAVNGGTLALSTKPYRWFCFIVKQGNTNSAGTDTNIQLEEFALYDEGGNRINIGLTKNTALQPTVLEPGQFTYPYDYNCYVSNNPPRDGDKLFDDSSAVSGWCVIYNNKRVLLTDTTSWLYLYFRLPLTAADVASYDICSFNGSSSSREITAWELRASRDGSKWVTLDSKRDMTPPATGRQWYSDHSAFASGQVRTGYPVTVPATVTDLVPNVSGLSVAPGAKLAATGLSATLNVLTVDFATGGGTIENCGFTKSGKLYVSDLPGGSVILPLTFTGCEALANLAKWQLYVNGERSEAYAISVSGDTVKLSALGTIFRLLP